MRTRWMAIAASLLLLLPLAQGAGAEPLADLSATQVRVDGGTLQGSLAGVTWFTPESREISGQALETAGGVGQDPTNTTFLQEGALRLAATVEGTQPKTGEPDAIPVPFLSIDAARARVSAYRAERYGAFDDPPFGVVDPSAHPPPDVFDLAGLRIDGGAVGDSESARILVLPMEGGSALAQRVGNLKVVPNGQEPAPTTQSEVGPEYTVDISQAMRVGSAGGAVTVSGSFRIVIDAIDVAYSAAGGDGTIHTRRDVHLPTAYYGATTVSAHSTVRAAVIDVWEATLVLDGGSLYLRQAIVTAPSVDVDGSTGQVAGRSVGDAPVHAEGEVVATLSAPTPDRLQVGLDGRMSLAIAGDAVPVPEGFAPGTAASVQAGPAGTLLLALLAVPSLPALHWASARRRFTRMDQALDRGDFATALRLANRFTPWPGQRQDSVLAAAICLLGLGRPAEACERLEGHRWSPGRRPMRDFLRARGHAALGQVDAAVRALAASLLAEPALIGQARTDPVLAALVDGPREPSSSSQEAYA